DIITTFGEIGGKEARDAAQAYWLDPTLERRIKYLETCLPFYNTRAEKDPDALRRAILRHDVGLAFNGPRNEQGRMDFRADLKRVRCPTLVLAGDRDPIMPMSLTQTLVSSLPPHLTRYERFENCGHGVQRDDPEKAFAVIREFILS